MSTLRIQNGAPVALDGWKEFFRDWDRKISNTVEDVWRFVRGSQQPGYPPYDPNYPPGGGNPPYDPYNPNYGQQSGIDPNTLLLMGGGALALILFLKKK